MLKLRVKRNVLCVNHTENRKTYFRQLRLMTVAGNVTFRRQQAEEHVNGALPHTAAALTSPCRPRALRPREALGGLSAHPGSGVPRALPPASVPCGEAAAGPACPRAPTTWLRVGSPRENHRSVIQKVVDFSKNSGRHETKQQKKPVLGQVINPDRRIHTTAFDATCPL